MYELMTEELIIHEIRIDSGRGDSDLQMMSFGSLCHLNSTMKAVL